MIDLLTNISSKTPIAMLPDVINHNNEMIKSEIYPEKIVNGIIEFPKNLKSLCNEKGEIQRSINIDSENTFKINHGEVTNDLNVYGKVITNGIVTKDLTINEKLNLSKTAITDFVDKYKYVFSNIITNDLVIEKIETELTKQYPLYDNKTIIEIKIDDYLVRSLEIQQLIQAIISSKIELLESEIEERVDNILLPASNSAIDQIFEEITPTVIVVQDDLNNN